MIPSNLSLINLLSQWESGLGTASPQSQGLANPLELTKQMELLEQINEARILQKKEWSEIKVHRHSNRINRDFEGGVSLAFDLLAKAHRHCISEEQVLPLLNRLHALGQSMTELTGTQRSLLHYAAGTGFPKVMQQLVLWGVDPHQIDDLGNSALHLAINGIGTSKTLDLTVIDLLWDWGLSEQLKNAQPRSSIDLFFSLSLSQMNPERCQSPEFLELFKRFVCRAQTTEQKIEIFKKSLTHSQSETMMSWILPKINKEEWQQDDSVILSIINRCASGKKINIPLLKRFIEAGVSVKGSDGDPLPLSAAIHVASLSPYPDTEIIEMLEVLKEAGALMARVRNPRNDEIITIHNSFHNSALNAAFFFSNEDILRWALHHSPPLKNLLDHPENIKKEILPEIKIFFMTLKESLQVGQLPQHQRNRRLLEQMEVLWLEKVELQSITDPQKGSIPQEPSSRSQQRL